MEGEVLASRGDSGIQVIPDKDGLLGSIFKLLSFLGTCMAPCTHVQMVSDISHLQAQNHLLHPISPHPQICSFLQLSMSKSMGLHSACFLLTLTSHPFANVVNSAVTKMSRTQLGSLLPLGPPWFPLLLLSHLGGHGPSCPFLPSQPLPWSVLHPAPRISF